MIWGVEGGGCQSLGDMSSIASSCRIDDSIQQLIQQIVWYWLEYVDPILPNWHFMFSGRYWSHSQDFQEFMLCPFYRFVFFNRLSRSHLSNNWGRIHGYEPLNVRIQMELYKRSKRKHFNNNKKCKKWQHRKNG